ncbi:DUF202 domain-containing protein [Micromonospora sp. ATA32]|nr:DUF202 domain-containing protein [Micromonospora sp. ATA32]
MTGDGGLQAERTRLAWRRTLLALTVVTVLTVRQAVTGGPTGVLLAGVAVLGWGATLALCWGRATRGALRTGTRPVPLTALATAGYALLGALLVLRGMW